MCLPEPAAEGSLEEGASQQEPPLCCSHCPELLCPLTPVTAVPGLLSALPAQPCWRAPAWGAAKVRPWVRLPCSRLSFRPRSDLRGFSGRKVSNAQPGGGFWLLSQWPASWCFLKGSGTWLAPWHVCYRGPGCVPAVSAGRRDCGAGLLCAGRSQPSARARARSRSRSWSQMGAHQAPEYSYGSTRAGAHLGGGRPGVPTGSDLHPETEGQLEVAPGGWSLLSCLLSNNRG